MKVLIFCLALCTLTHAVYMNRMSPINRMTSVNRLRSPTVFRPGVSMQGLQSFQGLHGFNLQSMQRPWNFGTMRLAPAASQRAPYFLYRSQPQRYAMKHYAPATRNMFTHSWKTTARLPLMAPATEFDFLKAASAQAEAHNDGGTGAIHTIPAPNLSLSEKPIVVLDASDMPDAEQAKPSYEVTEKYPEEYNVAKIEPPIGFTKANSFSTPDLQTLIRNGATLQLAPEYSMPTANRPHPLMPQQFQMVQGINNLPSHQDFLNTGAEGIFIAPNALFQSDPMYLQKIQTQLLQRFPAVEFIPYAADVQNHINFQPQQQQASEHNPHIVLLQNEQIDRPLPLQITEQIGNKNIVQRETQEASVVTIVPKGFAAPNTTEKQIEVNSSQQPQNLTVELVAIEPVSASSTVKYIVETSTEEGKTTPIYYAQVGQSVGNVIANGFYSAINDVRAAATVAQMEKGTVAQMEKAPETVPEKPVENTTTTTTLVPDVKAYFVPSEDKPGNETTAELKPLLGAPFKKATEPVNIAYTLVRADDKQPKLTQEGTVYAGQIVEATISEDQDFNKEKANLVSRRAPIRLFVAKDSNNIAGATKSTPTPEIEVVKAKLPAKSKLTFDHKTGEPIIRIYASYSDSTAQKDAVLTKLATLKPAKDSVIKRDLMESWKGTTVKTADKSQGFDANQVTQFGLKLKHRSDDYIPLFQEYED